MLFHRKGVGNSLEYWTRQSDRRNWLIVVALQHVRRVRWDKTEGGSWRTADLHLAKLGNTGREDEQVGVEQKSKTGLEPSRNRRRGEATPEQGQGGARPGQSKAKTMVKSGQRQLTTAAKVEFGSGFVGFSWRQARYGRTKTKRGRQTGRQADSRPAILQLQLGGGKARPGSDLTERDGQQPVRAVLGVIGMT